MILKQLHNKPWGCMLWVWDCWEAVGRAEGWLVLLQLDPALEIPKEIFKTHVMN